MKRHLQVIEEQLLLQVKKVSEALLMMLTGYLLTYCYYIFGYTHFLYIVYNFLLCLLFNFVLQKYLKQQSWLVMTLLISAQIPLLFIYHYSNYIFSLVVILTYLISFLTWRFKTFLYWWSLYVVMTVAIVFFPGALFLFIRGYNLLITGNLFFLHL